jgi:3-hydroxyisobutyrate dehydrogenase
MGGGMALRLLSQGWPVHVFDIMADRMAALASAGARAHASAAEAASAARATIVCVVDSGQSRDVLFGAGALAQSVPLGHTVLLCPTIAPADVEDIARALRPHGVFCIDAPMSGGPARAADGSMSLMVACENQVFERHHRLLDTLSSRLFRISERPGDGARSKLVNNLAHAGCDRAVQRAELDRHRAHATRHRGRLRPPRPHDAAGQGHPHGRAGGP